MGKCIFITVGTTRFDRLIETVFDERTNIIRTLVEHFDMDRLIVQRGQSRLPDCLPLNVRIESYEYKDSIADDIQQADFVISHAGAGTILQTLEKRKPLLVVVNEHLMNNHQTEIADQMETDGYLYHCTCSTLEQGVRRLLEHQFQTYVKGNPRLFGQYLNRLVC
jgi:beta-1,4-N-acetylglucosaminyltransferase